MADEIKDISDGGRANDPTEVSVIRENTQQRANDKVTPEMREAQILHSIKVLRDTDGLRFQRLAKQVAALSEQYALTQTGENHPLAAMLKTPFNDPVFDQLMSNVEEYRRRQDEQEAF